MTCIIQVLPALQQGGVERGTIEIARALQQAGIKNLVISAGGRMVHELEGLGVEHITLPVNTKNPFKIIANAKLLAKIFQEKEATLIHVRSRAPAWSVKLACRRTGIPYIASFHGVYKTEPAWFKKPYNRVMLSGEHVIAVSRHVKQHIIDTYGMNPDKITVIHRGADVIHFDPAKVSEEKVTYLREQWNIPENLPVITLVGRLTSWKGQSVLLEACSKMQHKNFVCLFVGSDQGRTEYHQALEKQAQALYGKPKVVFVEACRDMPALYRLSAVVVNASIEPEAFGRTIAEAQAMERIVVATAHGGACETIQDGQTGFLVPVGDATALAATLDKVLDMPSEELNKIEKQARQSVIDNFSVQKMCANTLDLYRRLEENAVSEAFTVPQGHVDNMPNDEKTI
ncbi:MAG: glycosyltransferase family 4 protein [Alphaproteobacteria bacterium]|nr:glycosyltransferase family 4 protein [Alphaproteobacteria bacterium]